VKLQSKSNPKYIKLLGAANISIDNFLRHDAHESYHDIFGLKEQKKPSSEELSNIPIGKIFLRSNFVPKIVSSKSQSKEPSAMPVVQPFKRYREELKIPEFGETSVEQVYTSPKVIS
jgi:hypothetical protein